MKVLNIILCLIAIPLLYFYLYGAFLHSDLVNTRTRTGDIDHGDQTAYLESIKKTYNESFRYLGDRNRMPLYSFFQAKLYKSGISDDQLFIRAKNVNIIFSLIFIFLIFLFNKKYLSRISNIVFILITSFAVFLPRAAYVQPELLFFTLSFFAFVYFCRTIKNQKGKDAFFAAIYGALSYLTKASMLLGFGFFVLFQFLYDLFVARSRKYLLIPIISLVIFLTIVSPYIIQTNKFYGNYFFNYPAMYAWEESWVNILTRYKDPWNIELVRSIPRNQLPSPAKYLREHTASHLALRMLSGTVLNVGIMLGTYALLSSTILIFYVLFLIYFMVSSIKGFNYKEIIVKNKRVIIFIPGYLLLYFLAFSWYTPIGAGTRFTLSLFMPALFSAFYLLEKLTIKAKVSEVYPTNKNLFYLTHAIAVFLLIIGVKIVIIPTILGSWAGL